MVRGIAGATALCLSLGLFSACGDSSEVASLSARYSPDFDLPPNECLTSAIYDYASGYGFDTVARALRGFGLDRGRMRLRELRPGFFTAEQRENGMPTAAYTVVLADLNRWIVSGSREPGECFHP